MRTMPFATSSLRRSFGTQLSARVLAVGVASNLTLLSVFGLAFLQGSERSQEAEAASVSRLLATALETPMLEGGYAEVADVVREAVALSDIGYARVTFADGNDLVEAGELRDGHWAPPLHETGIRYGNQQLGLVALQMAHTRTEEWLPSAVLALCGSLILSLSLAYGLFRPFIRRTESRIGTLKRSTESFARGDFEVRAAIPGEDEQADFGREFDRAVCQIAASQQQ
jgi:hypothetical protein